jgi:S1-C subfamily serine protease
MVVMRTALALTLVLLPSLAFAQPTPPPPQPAAPAPQVNKPAEVPAPANSNPAHIQAAQSEARKLSDAFVAVADKVGSSVVQVEVTARDDNDQVTRFFGRNGDSPVVRGVGSGVIFTPDGAIVTNNHVIDNALTINVRLRDGRYLPAKLVGRDPATDLAVIKVDAQSLAAAKFADSDQARVGEWVVAIGSPLGFTYSVTVGVLSAKGRAGLNMNSIEDYLQTDASINRGNSGGPLCDLDGRVLGINAMVVDPKVATGIGFALPSNMVRRIAEQLLKTGRVARAWIGVGIQDITPDLGVALKVDPRAGALVNQVHPGGPGEKANLKPGDVIASVGGKPVHDNHELIREIMTHEVGETVPLEIIRDGKHYGAQATLAQRPEPATAPLPVQQQNVPQSGLGFSVRELPADQARELGLPQKPLPVVSTVVPGSSADRAGIKVGDVVVEADGKVEPSPHELQEAARDGQVVLRLRRRDQAYYAALKK